MGCSPPPSNQPGSPSGKLELRESEPLNFKIAIREYGHDFVQFVALAFVPPLKILVHFAGWHRHGNYQSSVGAQYTVNLTERSSVVCYVFQDFKKQYGIEMLISKRESREGCRGKTNVPQIQVPGAGALKRITIDVNLNQIPCARAHVAHEDSRAAADIGSDSESIS